ncbi:sulfotransferase [Cesiribacter sp. SM1]|uniref:sulfotransferase n=1 Tax=Cesiribacter sp. SM1 TaxID=2861196 RepID=UPI001CD3B1B1|nr:sulfotransferase [Cesiribacter sp. SM1]
MNKLYNCIILSTKSAGSSALQKLLVKNYGFNMVKNTTHHENETLFWSKAASALDLYQDKMHRSKVPFSRSAALQALNKFLKDNSVEECLSADASKAEIFSAYFDLISQYKPLFVEKSPHHLYNQSNLDLLAEFACQYKDKVNVKFLGLVRHPLSVIYSGWDRWKHDCSEFEREWFVSNVNLLKNKESLNIDIVRYEDLVAENAAFLEEKLGLKPVSDAFSFRSSSLDKWKKDKAFGHQLSDETIELAKQFGYKDFDTSGEGLSWNFKSLSIYAGVELKRLLRKSAMYWLPFCYVNTPAADKMLG